MIHSVLKIERLAVVLNSDGVRKNNTANGTGDASVGSDADYAPNNL
jgi:hypothetical protein